MNKYKNKLNIDKEFLEREAEKKEEFYTMEVAVERVEAGLVGNLRIQDDINKPIIKKGDLVRLRRPSRLQKKDFILYQTHEEYFLRRIIKFVGDDIYVAGDNEREYHIINKDDVVAKVLSRERKLKSISFSLNPAKKLYTFKKVYFAPVRLGKRVSTYEQDLNASSFEAAQQAALESKTTYENKTEIKYTIDLDTDLKSFLDPDVLVHELRDAMLQNEQTEEVEEETKYEEVVYVDEEGNEIAVEEISEDEIQEGDEVEYIEIEE